MTRFLHLKVPDQYNQYFTKYPQGYTILEALLNWVQQVDNLVDNVNEWNTYLDDFVKEFDTDFPNTVRDILTKWKDDGVLDIIISENLNSRMNVVEEGFKKKTTEALRFHPTGGTKTPKLLYQSNTADTMLLITKKPSSDEYLIYTLKTGVVTANNSVGGAAELLRVTNVQNVLDCVVYKHTYKAIKSADGFNEYNFNYTLGQTSSRPLKAWKNVSATTTLADDFIEFDIVIPENGKFNVAFMLSAASTNNAIVKVGGVQVGNANLSIGSGVLIKEFEGTPGSQVVRIEVGQAAKLMYVFGVNFYHLKDWKGQQSDDFGYWQDNTRDYVTSQGAMDYAIVKADDGLYCGSYHGGETLTSRLLYENGNKNFVLGLGQFKVAFKIDINQITNIVGKLTAYSYQSFDSDGVYDLKVVMEGDLDVKTFYTCMTTTNDTFDRILYPIRQDITEDGDYPVGRTNTIVQLNTSNNQKVTTQFSIFDNDYDMKTPYVRAVTGAYNKVYYGFAVYSVPVKIKDIAFQTTRIFE